MDELTAQQREMSLLEEIERDPDTTQANLATRLGVAVGTVNWHLKRLVAKGYVKVKRAERRKLRYIITPEGISLRARLTVAYVEQSMSLYRETRSEARRLLKLVAKRGFEGVHVQGNGDLADVIRLTCLEQGIEVLREQPADSAPVLTIKGREMRVIWPERAADLGPEVETSHD
jgi:DNA-binding MarR family transcriptional regulator